MKTKQQKQLTKEQIEKQISIQGTWIIEVVTQSISLIGVPCSILINIDSNAVPSISSVYANDIGLNKPLEQEPAKKKNDYVG